MVQLHTCAVQTVKDIRLARRVLQHKSRGTALKLSIDLKLVSISLALIGAVLLLLIRRLSLRFLEASWTSLSANSTNQPKQGRLVHFSASTSTRSSASWGLEATSFSTPAVPTSTPAAPLTTSASTSPGLETTSLLSGVLVGSSTTTFSTSETATAKDEPLPAAATVYTQSIKLTADETRGRSSESPERTHIDIRSFADVELLFRKFRNKRVVYICHVLLPEDNLVYMYQPVISSLMSGFLSYDKIHTWTAVVVLRIEKHLLSFVWSRCELFKMFGRGDIFVWVGVFQETGPWLYLRSRGVYTIHYQTEHIKKCASNLVDESWDFNWHNVDMCTASDAAPKHVRYVPPGAVGNSPQASQAPVAVPNFFGYTDFRPCFERVQSELLSLTDDTIRVEQNVWSEQAFHSYIRTHSVFIVLHKECRHDNPYPFGVETVRLAQLLPADTIIISEHAYYKDEAEFKDMVTFVDVSEIPRAFLRVRFLNQSTRQAIADDRGRLYRQKFVPSLLFERAGIYKLMEFLST